MLNFKNDYSFGAHPKAMEALAKINLEGNVGFGVDPHCNRAADLIRKECNAPNADIYYFGGGTAANLTTIAAFLRPWEAVISADSGHIATHEAGAIEATGHKVLTVPSPDGKLTVAGVEKVLDEHRNPGLDVPGLMLTPRMVYISQSTEVGTIYSLAELTALSELCRANDLFLFVDGARIATALTASDCDMTLADVAALCDAFYIGGTKNGMLLGEAMVITHPEEQPCFATVLKQHGGLLAKGFVMGVQFEALLEDGLYWEIARHANAMAMKLQAGFEAKGFGLMQRSTTNQIFIIFPNELIPKLSEFCRYEIWEKWDDAHTVVRFVASFATTEEEVDALLAAL